MNFKISKYLYLTFAIIAMLGYATHVKAGVMSTSEDSKGVSISTDNRTIPVAQFMSTNSLIDAEGSIWELSTKTGEWGKSGSLETGVLTKIVNIPIPDPVPVLSSDDVINPAPIAPPARYVIPIPSSAAIPPAPPTSTSSSVAPTPNLSVTVPVKPGTTTKAIDEELINPTSPNPPTSTTISKEIPAKASVLPKDLGNKTSHSSEKVDKKSASTTLSSSSTSTTSTALTTKPQSVASQTNPIAHSESLLPQSKTSIKSTLPKTGESQSSDYFFKFMGLTILALVGFWFKGNSKNKSGTSFQ